jgi:hypothetical protein
MSEPGVPCACLQETMLAATELAILPNGLWLPRETIPCTMPWEDWRRAVRPDLSQPPPQKSDASSPPTDSSLPGSSNTAVSESTEKLLNAKGEGTSDTDQSSKPYAGTYVYNDGTSDTDQSSKA